VRGQDTIPLHKDAKETLRRLAQAGLSQVVLSASQIDILKKQLSLYGLENAFQDVLGHDNIYADSKEMIGIRYMEKAGLCTGECVMIGDTLHDAEVARAMGIECILVARGHQSADTLRTAGAPVACSLTEAAEIILQ
jgi:phosphoglycolate phosphatase